MTRIEQTARTTAMRTVVDPKMSLSLWLRAGRAAKGMSLEDVAKVTKIQPRILERLEAGKLEGLPAEVFVRGFVRSYARCCGLDEREALERYAQAAGQPTAPSAAVTRATALVESMSELAPSTASRRPRSLTDVPLAAGSLTDVPRQGTVIESFLPETGTLGEELQGAALASEPVAEAAPVVEAPPVVEAAPVTELVEPVVAATAVEVVTDEAPKKKRGRRGGKGRKRKQMAEGTPSSPMPIVAEPIVAEPIVAEAIAAEPIVAEPIVAEGTTIAQDASLAGTSLDAATAPEETSTESTEPAQPWAPKMPVVTPSVPWRRPTSMLMSRSSGAAVVPSLVIDDADPESAERELEDRAAAKEPVRRSFLPPILLDREDRSARQGGLTLAVIILLIAATLTLSYLMRRPSSTGDGVTQLDGTAQIVDVTV